MAVWHNAAWPTFEKCIALSGETCPRPCNCATVASKRAIRVLTLTPDLWRRVHPKLHKPKVAPHPSDRSNLWQPETCTGNLQQQPVRTPGYTRESPCTNTRARTLTQTASPAIPKGLVPEHVVVSLHKCCASKLTASPRLNKKLAGKAMTTMTPALREVVGPRRSSFCWLILSFATSP